MSKIQLVLVVSLVAFIILSYSQNKTIKKLETTIANQNEINITEEKLNEEVTFTESIKMKSLQDELKTKNEIIRMDNVIFTKHARELELYGDFIIAIIKGDNREELLSREGAIEAGAKMTEIRREIEELIKTRKENI